MKQTRLNIVTKNEKYPIIIGSNLTSSLSKIFKLNSIYFDKCLIVVDRGVPKKFVSNIKRSLKNKTKIFLFLKDLLIFETNFFGTFLSTTIKHLSKSIEFDLKIFDMLEVKFDPIIIGYFSVLVTIFNLVCFINFYNFIYYFTFRKIITLYFI